MKRGKIVRLPLFQDTEPVYVIDTSAWLNIDSRPDAAQVWDLIDSLINKGRIVVPRDVIRELRDNPIYKSHVKLHEPVLLASDHGEDPMFLQRVGIIVNKYPGMSKARGTRTPADPFIIAFAEMHGCIVVCDETTTKRRNRKIPTVCADRKIKCLTLNEFVKAEDRTSARVADQQSSPISKLPHTHPDEISTP
jgi:hypothetical protein